MGGLGRSLHLITHHPSPIEFFIQPIRPSLKRKGKSEKGKGVEEKRNSRRALSSLAYFSLSPFPSGSRRYSTYILSI
jgi:hypothetical protein